jgi:hypothetical protein
VFEVYTETHSVVKVVAYLIPATDREWRLDDATYMLRNEVYRGVLRFGQNVNPNAYTRLHAHRVSGVVGRRLNG